MTIVRLLGLAAVLGVAVMAAGPAVAQDDFVNFETPHVHPLDLAPGGLLLAAVNTADNRVEFFDVSGEHPRLVRSVPVGMDPCSVRFRNGGEAWVVNHISDSVSVVNVTTGAVRATIATQDEPCDVVFAGNPLRAFVSCSQANTVQVFNPGNLSAAPSTVNIFAEDPRALAVSRDGTKVYAAIYESGNRSTVAMGSADGQGRITFPPNVVGAGGTPHGTMNPAFNGDNAFIPAKAANGVPPRVSLIVKQDPNGAWRDDTGSDWTRWISGDKAAESGRPEGWTLIDHDVAVIDTATLGVGYIDGLMNINMAIAVNPSTGEVTTVGTDGINELRFEPNVNSIFVRVMLGTGDPASLGVNGIADLNAGHLNYTLRKVAQSERNKSIGDPRGIVWRSDGSKAYVAGMGSNNVVAINANGARVGSPIAVGQGPTGLALDEVAMRLYVLNRFDASISVVNASAGNVVETVPFFDPTPAVIKQGRPFLYDTHRTSGLGQASCGACHVDSRMDRLAWDLGDPSGAVKGTTGLNLGAGVPTLNTGFKSFHPMKGPMTTQTLQDIIGKEPFHWRGDRLGLEEFNGAFVSLLGDDATLSEQEMAAFKSYLGTIHFPPNPYRNLDNTLPANLPLPGHYTPGRFSPAGNGLPNGNAQAGMALYRNTTRLLDSGALACVTCHTLPTGTGTDTRIIGLNNQLRDIAVDANGNHHTMMVSIDGSTNVTLKVPHLRNLYDKVGMDLTHPVSKAGFGFTPDGSVDSLEHFVSEDVFDVESDQEVANLTAFLLCFSGSDLPDGSYDLLDFEPPGRPGNDAHAAVGQQFTLASAAASTAKLDTLLNIDLASQRIETVAHVVQGGGVRGYLRTGANAWQPDAEGPTVDLAALKALAGAGHEITFTVVPAGTGMRLALDRDRDGYYNYDEVLNCTDPADPNSHGVGQCPEGEGAMEGEPEGTTEGQPEGAGEGNVEGAPEGEGMDDGVHSADTQLDGKIDLTELLRSVQLYNAGSIHCDGGSEDGYGLGAGSHTCGRYDADYAAPAWVLSLSELLRIVQLFNSGGYSICIGSEDGFCPLSR